MTALSLMAHEPAAATLKARLAQLRAVIRDTAVHRDDPGTSLLANGGGRLDWLIDLRPVLLDPACLEVLAAAIWSKLCAHPLIHNRQGLQVAAVETAAIPLLTAVLMRVPPEVRGPVNGLIIRKERKTTGRGNLVEGTLRDAPIVLLDDILNSGKSADKARVALAEAGHLITLSLVIIDYSSISGRAWRQSAAIEVQSVFNLADFGVSLAVEPPATEMAYTELWSTDVSGANAYHVVPKSAPVLAGELLFRGSDSARMHAFDTQTGRIVWEHTATGAVPSKGIWSTPAIHDGRLYYGAYNGVLYCLDAATGVEIWAQSLGEWIGASPLIVARHGLLFIGVEHARPWAQGSLCAVRLDTGTKVWERLVRGLQHGSAAYWKGGDLVVWGSADYDMFGLEPQTGHVRWSLRTKRSVKLAPAISEVRGLAAFASFDCSIYLVELATGRLKGQWETGEICYTTPAFAGNRLFCGSGDRHLYMINLDTLAVEDKRHMGARLYASPTVIGDRVIVATNGGRIVEIDAMSLETKGRFHVGDAVTNGVCPAIDGSILYVSTAMNRLHAFARRDARLGGGERP